MGVRAFRINYPRAQPGYAQQDSSLSKRVECIFACVLRRAALGLSQPLPGFNLPPTFTLQEEMYESVMILGAHWLICHLSV